MSEWFRWNGARVKVSLNRKRKEALRDAAEYLLDESKKLVPFDEGVLSASGSVAVNEKGTKAVVGYNTPYAVYQHERTDLYHPNGRSAKYLERPLREKRQQIIEYLRRRLREAV